jgi:hypothetical protein
MINKIIENKNKIMIAISLIVIGSIIRILFHTSLPAFKSAYITINGLTQPMFMLDLFFIVAVIAIISGLLLGGYYTFIIPISVMIITDIVIGNNWILLFTWSGFALLGLIGLLIKSKRILTFRNIPTFLGAGIGGILIYDIWTNFGTWLGGFGYAPTLGGLAQCYTMALPFMLWHLLSTTIVLSVILITVIYLKEHRLKIPYVNVEPIENHMTYAIPVILVLIALLSVLV